MEWEQPALPPTHLSWKEGRREAEKNKRGREEREGGRVGEGGRRRGNDKDRQMRPAHRSQGHMRSHDLLPGVQEMTCGHWSSSLAPESGQKPFPGALDPYCCPLWEGRCVGGEQEKQGTLASCFCTLKGSELQFSSTYRLQSGVPRAPRRRKTTLRLSLSSCLDILLRFLLGFIFCLSLPKPTSYIQQQVPK